MAQYGSGSATKLEFGTSTAEVRDSGSYLCSTMRSPRRDTSALGLETRNRRFWQAARLFHARWHSLFGMMQEWSRQVPQTIAHVHQKRMRCGVAAGGPRVPVSERFRQTYMLFITWRYPTRLEHYSSLKYPSP
ncbi:hypothetical protein BC826DRAFT_972168 [Russula brevipes]|nr:hypothetical protein BC826DRAFT_972168 [Russula brevipes]